MLALLVSCSERAQHDAPPPILLFAGTGTSAGDVGALETLLETAHLSYEKASSWELDHMSAAAMRAHRLVIVPGGNFEVMGKSLAPATSAKLRDAVRAGTSYLGICAGAFYAGNSPFNGLDLTNGVRFRFYAAEARGIRKAAVRVSAQGEPPMDHYWEDGPDLEGWGTSVAEYMDGGIAAAEGRYGKGWVLLVGTHPEAPDSWRGDLAFKTPMKESREYAGRLIRAALEGSSLETPHVPDGPTSGPLAAPSRKFREDGDFASLQTLTAHLHKGMSYREVISLLGAPDYSPTDGQYYVSSNRDEWVADAQRSCVSGLVLEFRNRETDEIAGLQDWVLGPICE